MQRYIPGLLHRILLLSLILTLIYLSFSVLKYFIIPVVWAMIVAYMTWPIYEWIRAKCGPKRHTLNASIMLLLIIFIIGLPIAFGIVTLQQEGQNLYIQLQHQLMSGNLSLPEFILELPVIGSEANKLVTTLNNNPESLTQHLFTWLQSHLNYGRFVIGEIGRNIVKLSFTLLSLFFFYRDGKSLLNQFHFALQKIIGTRINHYIETISDTTRAVVYGIGLTALVQAILAGLSYFVADVPNPVVITLVTFVLALIPFGTPISYCSVALWLFSQGRVVAAVAVLAWGFGIVSTSDNVIRPLVISGKTKIPFLLIMFGVLGGITSFGLIGVFIGPVILAIVLAIWREWINEPAYQAYKPPQSQ